MDERGAGELLGAALRAASASKNELSGVDLTEGWYDAVTAPLPDGSPIESVGPIVLGWRLISSRASDAYQPIVYMKGAVVMDMLARSLGEDVFPKVLQQVVKAGGGRTISTEDLFSDDRDGHLHRPRRPSRRSTSTAPACPRCYYDCRFEKTAERLAGQGHGPPADAAPLPLQGGAPRTGGPSTWCARRRRQVDVKTSTVVVPVTIAVYNPEAGKAGQGRRRTARCTATSCSRARPREFAINVTYEPKRVWLDKDKRVFASFLDEDRHPKWFQYLQGQTAAAAGEPAAAAAFYDKALAAKEPPPDDGRTVYYEDMKWRERRLNAWIELSRARLHLDQGDEAAAEAAIGRAQRTLGEDYATVRVLRARLEIRRGDYEKACRRLRKGVIASETLDTSEAYVLMAVAAQKSGHADDFAKALKRAKDTGADVSALTGS